MKVLPDISVMLVGVAIFLLGMNFMEESLHTLAGRRFKLFLKNQTSKGFKAVSAGASASALLQSSSVVNMLILSLMGTGVMQTRNALATMLGSNLGTTISSWMMATIGFSFTLDTFWLLLAGITGIAINFFKKTGAWYKWLKFLLGFSFLFAGLEFIKDGMQEIVSGTDLSQFSRQGPLMFLLLGFVLTALTQSSSATAAIALSALYSGGINLYMATAIALGSEIGTTLKLFPAAASGIPEKKRVALGNFLFNIVTAAVIFILLRPVNLLITDVLSIQNGLIALAFFQSLVNIASIILFLPFLYKVGQYLDKRFVSGEKVYKFINNEMISDVDLALDAVEKETRRFMQLVLKFSISSFSDESDLIGGMEYKKFAEKSTNEQYDYLKRLYGEIHRYCSKVQNEPKTDKQTERLDGLISSARNSMYAAKNMRDISHDIIQLRNSSNDHKYGYYLAVWEKVSSFCRKVSGMLEEKPSQPVESMKQLFNEVQQGYTSSLQGLYQTGLVEGLREREVATFINFNREIYTAFKSITFAVKDYLLTSKESEYFEELPGFIR